MFKKLSGHGLAQTKHEVSITMTEMVNLGSHLDWIERLTWLESTHVDMCVIVC